MIDMQNNSLLNKIIEYARTLGNSAKPTMSAERYIISVIDVITGVSGIETSDEEKNVLLEMLSACLPKENSSFSDVKAYLMKHVQEDEGNSYLDTLYMQKCIYKAKEAAKKKNLEQLSPEVLLACIFNEPNSFLKGILQNDEKGGAAGFDTEAFLKRSGDNASAEESKEKEHPQTAEPAAPEQELDPREAITALTKKVKSIHEQLDEVIFGQENAIGVFTSGYFQSELLSIENKTRERPAGTFLFAGPPGVGKTYLVETIVKVLEMQDHFKRFDMSEFADSQSYIDLIGFGDNYKTPQEGLLTGFVRKHPKCILLFDEIEKAHLSVINLFLQILDKGFLTDSKTLRKVLFHDALIFFTTNAGKELYQAPDAFDFSGISKKVILKSLQKEISPLTHTPIFPAAICSRFASGNVVMFNHMTAGTLLKIAKKEVSRQVESFEEQYNISVNLDKSVYTALLFAEGGAADARTVRGRAARFFDDEIFELFRLISSEEHSGDISKLQSISFTIDLPEDEEIRSLFINKSTHNILLLSAGDVAEQCRGVCGDVNVFDAQSVESVKDTLSNKVINFAIIGLSFGTPDERPFLNIEDVDSCARDAFWYIREKYADLPVYILQRNGQALTSEEKKSFLSAGARGFLFFDPENMQFADEVGRVCEELYQQASMQKLARSNKLVSFESGQRISADGEAAEITLFDFELSTAVDAEDTQNIMSNVSKPDVKFSQIIGAENAKEELRFFINYLKDPKKFKETGLRTPRGVLLYGPPGTGKTMLAKAVASEADVTFISAEGNQFIKKYVGQGKDDLVELFAVARKYSPSILFIDEFESIAKERQGGEHAFANAEDVLTALLTQMDGFNTDISKPVFLLAATNFDVTPGSGRSLDQALLRRFDSKIFVDLPNKKERIQFLKMKIDGNKAFELSEEEIESIAVRSTGMSPAQLESILELSLRMAIRKDDFKVTDAVLDEAFETFLGGEEKEWDASQLERTARHEAGHAFLCWQSGETPSYLTIVARGDHGGYMQHDHNEGKAIYTKEELLGRIRTALGGRAAEIVFYGEKDGISTGPSGDLATATEIAQHIICTYGMDEAFGLAVVGPREVQAGEISGKVREAVNQILADELQKAVRLISENRAAVSALVDKLMTENHLNGDEIRKVFEESANPDR